MRHLHPTFSCIMALLHPLLYLLVSRVLHGVVGASTRRCTFARKIGQHRTIACYPRFVPAVAHVRYDKLLPRHQGPRRRMYFHAGDVPQIRSQPTKVIQRDILRSIPEKLVHHPGTLHFLFCHRYFIIRCIFSTRCSRRSANTYSPLMCLFLCVRRARERLLLLSER